MQTINISQGFHESERSHVAQLYWQAFGTKLSFGLGPDEAALRFLERCADPKFAICARDEAGQLVGIAGYKIKEGCFIDGEFSDLAAVYGWAGAVWRGALLSILERALEQDVLLMDGIFVDSKARGMGVGTLLLSAVKDLGRAQGCSTVRLDVIDSNARARALYEREGFVAGKTRNLSFLRSIFKFSKSTEMYCPLQPHS